MSKMLAIVGLVINFSLLTSAISSISNETQTSAEDSNSTVPQDLYIFKTVIYEIGILTNASNITDDVVNTTQDQIDISFFQTPSNDGLLDLSSIPIPIQTNVSGVTVTGLLPANLDLRSIVGGLSPSNIPNTDQNATNFPIWPQKQVKVTQNVSTLDPIRGSDIISNLPKILGLTGITNNTVPSHETTGE